MYVYFIFISIHYFHYIAIRLHLHIYIHIYTVEALVSDHPRGLKKVVATRTGRLREFDREIAQCRKNYLYVYTLSFNMYFNVLTRTVFNKTTLGQNQPSP